MSSATVGGHEPAAVWSPAGAGDNGVMTTTAFSAGGGTGDS